MNKIVAINDIAEINPRVPRTLAQDTERIVSFVPMSGISENGRLAEAVDKPLTEVLRGYTYFERGDILFAKITPCMENGKAAYLVDLPNEVGFGSTEFHVLRPGPEINGLYLFYLIWNPAFRFAAENIMSGAAGQKRVPTDFLKTYKILLPPLDEQRRIAAILDKADAIRRKRQESIRLTEEFLRLTFLDMFGDPMSNPKGWDKAPIKELGNITTGNTPFRERSEYYGDGIEWIKSDNINTPYHFLTKSKERLTLDGQKVGRVVPENSTLVTCIAGSPECIGNAAIADRPVAFNQQINAVTPFKGTDPFFLYVQILVAKKLIQGQSTESMKGMVNKGKFENIPFLKPPTELQEEFGKIFIRAHGMIQRANASSEQSTNIFNSLTQRAFRGEL